MKSGKSLHDNIAVQFMNSIFTNALPGQNEDSHIYTLKERFNQENVSNNENNNNNYNDEQMLSDIHQRDDRDRERDRDSIDEEKYKDYKDYNDKDMRDDYDYRSMSRHHNRSRSRSRSRMRERSRERDKFRDRRDQRSRSKKYSRSNSRNYRRNNSKIDDYRKRRGDSEREKNMGRIYQNPYSFFSYTENGVTKINTYFTVPDHLVSLLIGKKGENVRAIMNSTGAIVTFCKEVSNISFYYILIFVIV